MKLRNQLAVCVLSATLCLAADCRNTGYILRTEDGILCIFDAQTGDCLSKTGTPAASLPDADREALDKGLHFGTFPELTRACEDYCS